MTVIQYQGVQGFWTPNKLVLSWYLPLLTKHASSVSLDLDLTKGHDFQRNMFARQQGHQHCVQASLSEVQARSLRQVLDAFNSPRTGITETLGKLAKIRKLPNLKVIPFQSASCFTNKMHFEKKVSAATRDTRTHEGCPVVCRMPLDASVADGKMCQDFDSALGSSFQSKNPMFCY